MSFWTPNIGLSIMMERKRWFLNDSLCEKSLKSPSQKWFYCCVSERCGGQSLALWCPTWHHEISCWLELLVLIEMCNWTLGGWTCLWLNRRIKQTKQNLNLSQSNWWFHSLLMVFCGWQVLSKWMWGGSPQVTASDFNCWWPLVLHPYYFPPPVCSFICCVIDKLMSCI